MKTYYEQLLSLLLAIQICRELFIQSSIDNSAYIIYSGLSFFVVKFIVGINHSKSNVVFFLLLCLICTVEVFIGVSQIIEQISTGVTGLSCTGSFSNSGPYGGFLAVCISILFAYSIFGTNIIIKFYAKILLLLSFVIVSYTQSRAALLAIIVSSWLILRKTKYNLVIMRYKILICCCLTLLGICLYCAKRPSADGRYFMNKICAISIRDSINWGFSNYSFAGVYGATQYSYFYEIIKDDLAMNNENAGERIISDCPNNAFNEYMQIAIEDGVLILLLFLIFMFVTFQISYRNNNIWCYGMAAMSVFALFSYPFHLFQFKLFLPLLFALCLTNDNTSIKNNVIPIMMIIELSIIMYLVLPLLIDKRKANEAFENTTHWYNLGFYDYVVEDCDSLFEQLKDQSFFLFTYGQSLNRIGQYEKSDSILKIGTKISSDPMFWNVMGNNSLALGRYQEAEERYKHAFYMVPNRLYPLTLLAKLYDVEGDTVRFLKMAETVENFVPKVESVNTECLRQEIRDIKAGYIDPTREDE